MLPLARPCSCLALAVLAAGAGACSPGDPPVIHEYDPYEGEAYPDRRTPLVVPEGGVGFVTNSYSDTVTAIALATGEVLVTVPVGRDPVSLDGPHHVAASASGDAVYIGLSYPVLGLSGPHASHGSSQRSGYAQKLEGGELRVVGQVRVDTNPGDIVLSEDGKRLVTSHFDLQRALDNLDNIDAARATIAVIDPTKMAMHGSPAATRIPTCVAPHGVVLSRPDAARAYVACYGEDVVTVVDLDTSTVTARVPVGAGADGFGDPVYGPYSIVESPSGDLLAVGNTVSKDVRLFDPEAEAMKEGAVLSTFGAPYFPAWYPDGTKLLVPTQGPDEVVVFDVASQAEITKRDFAGDECVLPHVAVPMDDGTFALVCEGDHASPGKVVWLDPDTLETVRSTPVGVYPDGLAVVRKGAK